MNQWKNTVLTDKGVSLLYKLSQGRSLELTKAKTGIGSVPVGNLRAQTKVNAEEQTLTFREVQYLGSGRCVITVSLENATVTQGYRARQVGIYAKDPTEGEILFLISQATDEASATVVPSATEMPGYRAEWNFYLQYGNADGVTVTVDNAHCVSYDEMANHLKNNVKAISNEQIDAILAT